MDGFTGFKEPVSCLCKSGSRYGLQVGVDAVGVDKGEFAEGAFQP